MKKKIKWRRKFPNERSERENCAIETKGKREADFFADKNRTLKND